MNHVEQIIAVSKTYLDTSPGQSLDVRSLSWKVFSDTNRLERLMRGADLTTRSWERAMQWFSDHWPDGAQWPEGVHRPEPLQEGAAA